MPRAEAFARLFEAVHEGVYIGVLRASDTVTLAANPYLKLIFGYEPDIPETDVRPFDPDRFVDLQARSDFIEKLATGGAVTDYLLRLRRAGNRPFWVEVTAQADPPDAMGAVHVEALVRDVSERKRLEDQARDLYHQLLQAEKMASLGQTISGVAHELNNPLATILMWAERLAAGARDEPTRRGLDHILHESQRAARIVRSLLTFARKRQSTRSLIDVNQVVRETLALRAYEQRVANITTIEALAAGLPQAFADGHQMQQVLLNLIINAEQAMLAAHGRGTLVVRTWHDAPRDRVMLEIADDGPGIPEDLQPKVFDPFFTTKEVGKGTGLGLTVAYAIVEEHGGRISLDSRPDAGTSFFIELPVSGLGLPPVTGASDARPSARKVAGAAVLVVEDEPALAAAVADALVDAGFLADRARDGEEAIERVDARAYDVVICDLKMPRVDGVTFYKHVAASAPTLTRRIVFVTGDVVGTEAERFLDESGCRWLPKPFRLAELLRIVRDVAEA
jgi:signal transduction histidine kinase